jgi:hypothetical protein
MLFDGEGGCNSGEGDAGEGWTPVVTASTLTCMHAALDTESFFFTNFSNQIKSSFENSLQN